MKKHIIIAFALIFVLCTLFAGCSAKSSVPHNGASYEAKNDYGYLSDYESPMSTQAPSSQSGDDVLAGRKIIRNAELTVQTLDFDSFINGAIEKINSLGGYIESNSVDGNSYSSGRSMRSARLVARIPAEKLDEFLSVIDGLGNVTSRREGLSDVTDTYVDIEARIASLRTEYDTLLGLLEKAETLDEILKLQDRLTDVRYELESYEARIRSYDSQIAFSKVSMSISEVERETPVEEETFGQEVSRRFRESLEDVGEGFRDFAAWLIGNLPMILVWLVLLVALPLIIVLICVKSAKKRAEKRRLERERALENKTASAQPERRE